MVATMDNTLPTKGISQSSKGVDLKKFKNQNQTLEDTGEGLDFKDQVVNKTFNFADTLGTQYKDRFDKKRILFNNDKRNSETVDLSNANAVFKPLHDNHMNLAKLPAKDDRTKYAL
jgi:hypothetical protein